MNNKTDFLLAALGTQMFVFMWIATSFAILAWIINWGMCCCCASRRDVKTGRRRGNSAAYGHGQGMTGAANDQIFESSGSNNVIGDEKYKSAGSKRGRLAFGGFGRRRDTTESV